MTARLQATLRGQLLLRLSVPLLLIMVVGATVSLAAARHFAAQVYDQWLYDSAMALALQVKPGPDGPTVTLPAPAREILEWDRVDHVSYQVRIDGQHIFGTAQLEPPPVSARTHDPVFYDGKLGQDPVHMAAVTVPIGDKIATVIVAETLNKRNEMVSDILVAIMPVEIIFILLTAALIWVAISTALRRVNGVAGELVRVDSENLKPLDDPHGLPAEIWPLVDALNDLIARLADARDATRRFVANAAHQLRTPLAAMQIQVQRALRETDPALQREALAAVDKALVRLTHLTQQLLTLARAEPASAAVAHKQRVDLGTLARKELEQFADQAIARGIDLGYSGPDAGPVILGEAQLLTDLIDNLVDNAIRYAGDNAHVTLRLEQHPLRLIVEDNGPGIPAEERTRVLERFYRSKAAQGTGTGLGLAIASEIVKRHDATLRIAEARGGRGTEITVEFGRQMLEEGLAPNPLPVRPAAA